MDAKLKFVPLGHRETLYSKVAGVIKTRLF